MDEPRADDPRDHPPGRDGVAVVLVHAAAQKT